MERLPVSAMSLGTPVMTSKSASLAEIAGDAAPPVDPLDIRGMTKTVQVIDSDSDLRADLGRRGTERAKLFSPAVYRKPIGALHRSMLD
jgi:glycosyltransferase involved in cell wall biosynthesis